MCKNSTPRRCSKTCKRPRSYARHGRPRRPRKRVFAADGALCSEPFGFFPILRTTDIGTATRVNARSRRSSRPWRCTFPLLHNNNNNTRPYSYAFLCRVPGEDSISARLRRRQPLPPAGSDAKTRGVASVIPPPATRAEGDLHLRAKTFA